MQRPATGFMSSVPLDSYAANKLLHDRIAYLEKEVERRKVDQADVVKINNKLYKENLQLWQDKYFNKDTVQNTVKYETRLRQLKAECAALESNKEKKSAQSGVKELTDAITSLTVERDKFKVEIANLKKQNETVEAKLSTCLNLYNTLTKYGDQLTKKKRPAAKKVDSKRYRTPDQIAADLIEQTRAETQSKEVNNEKSPELPSSNTNRKTPEIHFSSTNRKIASARKSSSATRFPVVSKSPDDEIPGLEELRPTPISPIVEADFESVSESESDTMEVDNATSKQANQIPVRAPSPKLIASGESSQERGFVRQFLTNVGFATNPLRTWKIGSDSDTGSDNQPTRPTVKRRTLPKPNRSEITINVSDDSEIDTESDDSV